MAGKSIYLTEKEATLIREIVGAKMESDDEGLMARDGHALMVKLKNAFGFSLPTSPEDWNS